jgi:hypothetical protein
MLSRGEQVERIVTAWADRETERGLIRTDRTTATALAMVALTALECGAEHPARPDVRCDQLPHGNGHLYHRNSDLQVEWWASGDRGPMTVHDVLGPIQLVQAPVRAGVEIRVPFIGGKTDTGTRQEQHPGRYHTLPPCEDDPAEEADHGPWGVGDTIPDHVDHVENAHKFEWSRVRNRVGENAGWFELAASPVLTEADLLVLCGPVTESTDPPELVDALSATIDADRAVYRDLVPVLGPVATFLDQMGKRYREGNPRTTADQCRAAETFRDQLTTVVDTLQEMTGTGTDDQA